MTNEAEYVIEWASSQGIHLEQWQCEVIRRLYSTPERGRQFLLARIYGKTTLHRVITGARASRLAEK